MDNSKNHIIENIHNELNVRMDDDDDNVFNSDSTYFEPCPEMETAAGPSEMEICESSQDLPTSTKTEEQDKNNSAAEQRDTNCKDHSTVSNIKCDIDELGSFEDLDFDNFSAELDFKVLDTVNEYVDDEGDWDDDAKFISEIEKFLSSETTKNRNRIREIHHLDGKAKVGGNYKKYVDFVKNYLALFRNDFNQYKFWVNGMSHDFSKDDADKIVEALIKRRNYLETLNTNFRAELSPNELEAWHSEDFSSHNLIVRMTDKLISFYANKIDYCDKKFLESVKVAADTVDLTLSSEASSSNPTKSQEDKAASCDNSSVKNDELKRSTSIKSKKRHMENGFETILKQLKSSDDSQKYVEGDVPSTSNALTRCEYEISLQQANSQLDRAMSLPLEGTCSFMIDDRRSLLDPPKQLFHSSEETCKSSTSKTIVHLDVDHHLTGQLLTKNETLSCKNDLQLGICDQPIKKNSLFDDRKTSEGVNRLNKREVEKMMIDNRKDLSTLRLAGEEKNEYFEVSGFDDFFISHLFLDEASEDFRISNSQDNSVEVNSRIQICYNDFTALEYRMMSGSEIFWFVYDDFGFNENGTSKYNDDDDDDEGFSN